MTNPEHIFQAIEQRDEAEAAVKDAVRPVTRQIGRAIWGMDSADDFEALTQLDSGGLGIAYALSDSFDDLHERLYIEVSSAEILDPPLLFSRLRWEYLGKCHDCWERRDGTRSTCKFCRVELAPLLIEEDETVDTAAELLRWALEHSPDEDVIGGLKCLSPEIRKGLPDDLVLLLLGHPDREVRLFAQIHLLTPDEPAPGPDVPGQVR